MDCIYIYMSVCCVLLCVCTFLYLCVSVCVCLENKNETRLSQEGPNGSETHRSVNGVTLPKTGFRLAYSIGGPDGGMEP